MKTNLPICRWRGQHENGNATCASVKVRSPATGFDAASVCINRSGSPCIFADHEPVTEEQLAARRARQTPPPANGPGTEMKAMLASMGINPESCQCERRAAQMNRWGVAGCREHRLEIAAWLREAATQAITDFAVTDPVEAFLPLVDEAIRRAEQG